MKKQKTLHRFAAVAAVLLAFCLVFMAPVGAAVAETDVAKIGDIGYSTLQAAFDAADEGDTIVLCKDLIITQSSATKIQNSNYESSKPSTLNSNPEYWYDGIQYTGDKSFTVNLNGKTISCDNTINDYLIYLTNKGNKVNEISFINGNIQGGSNTWAVICVSGTASTQTTTLNLGNNLKVIVNASAFDGEKAGVIPRHSSTVNVLSGATIESSDLTAAKNVYLLNAAGGIINVYDGAIINAKKDGYIGIIGNGVVNIYGGTITATKTAIHTSTSGKGDFTIYGGSIIAPDAVVSSADLNNYNTAAPVVKIVGGSIDGTVSVINYGTSSKSNGATLTVIGGKFTDSGDSFTGTNYIPSGYQLDSTSGKVSATNSVAKVGDVGYATLADAITAATPGSTVTVLEDCTVSDVIKIEKQLTITGNGDVTITGTAKKIFEVYADADFKNLNLVNGVDYGRCIDTRTDDIEVNINNCVLTANGGGNPQPLTIGDYKKEGLTVTLSGTTIDAGKSGYGITTFVPVTLIIKDESEITGYGALYFKDGSDSTSVTISESTITGNNKYSEEGGNSFGVFILEEKGITVTLEESANVALASAKGTAVESIFLFNTEWNADARSGNTINVEANVHLATDGENTEFATNVYENTLNIQKCVTSNFQIESKYLDTTGEEKLASVATRINENGVVTEYTVQAVSEETVVPETPKVETLVTTDQNGAVTSTTISKPTGEETSIKKTGYDAVTITQTSNSGSGSSSESTETPVVTIVIKGITDSAFINSDDGTEFNSVTIPANAEITATYAPIEAASDGETEGTEKTQVSLSLKIDNISKPLPVIDASIREEVIEQVDEKSTAPVTILAMITAVGEDKNTNIKGSDEKAIAITFKVPASAVTDKNMLRAYHVVAGNPEALPNPIVSGPEEGFYTITIYGSSFSSYVLVEEEPQQYTGGSATDTGSGNYQYYPRSVPTDGIVDFGTSKVITGMELPAGSDGTVTLNIKPTFSMPENGFYAFEIDAPGYNTDAKINGGLSFQIPVADLEAAGWTAEDIVLFHGTVGEDGKITWEALPTNLVKNENGVAYYKAAINSCSPFYIGFVKDGSVVNTEVVDPVTPETPETSVTPDEPEVLPPVDEPETPEQPTESPAPILAVLAGLGAAVVLRRK